MTITLEEFIAKTREKEDKKIKIIILNVPDFGDIEFQRPSENKFLKFSNGMLGAIKDINLSETATEKLKTENINMIDFSKAASEFIYHSCSYMRAEEIRNLYKIYAFEDIPLCILGQNEVINLATKLYEAFNGKKEVEEIQEELKN